MTQGGPKLPGGHEEPSFELQTDADQLVEIARAEAVLNRRDPDQAAQVVRAQVLHGDTAVERRWRAARIEAAAKESKEARRRRRIQLAVVAVVLAAGAVPAARVVMRETDRRAALEARLGSLRRPAEALGLHEAGHWLDVPQAGVTIQVPRDTCSALVAAREGTEGPVPLEVERPGAPRITASGGVVWCSCEAEKITVTVPAGAGGRHALGWMSAPTRTTGGVDVLAARPADGLALVSDALALSCADAGFQGWATRGAHGDVDPLDPKRLAPTSPAAQLLAEGFEPVGLFGGERTFGVVRAARGRCFVAVPEPGRGEIALRGPDGARLVTEAGGAVVWCSHAADAVFSLWRAEKGGRPVAVLGAPADRTGGVMGAVLAARRHGFRDVKTAVLAEELASDARAALVAATVPAASIQGADATGLPGKPENKVAAFSLRGKGTMVPEVAPAVPTACLPEQEGEPPPPAFLCAQARGQAWHRGGDVQHQGAVEGMRPYWLGVLDGARDEGALRAVAALLVLAQRLGMLGFEPTTMEGVKDSPEGAVVSGLGAKGDVVAVGLSRSRPWASPLTDGPTWSLLGTPRVISIRPGTTKTLRSEARLAAEANDRRVVVWRR